MFEMLSYNLKDKSKGEITFGRKVTLSKWGYSLILSHRVPSSASINTPSSEPHSTKMAPSESQQNEAQAEPPAANSTVDTNNVVEAANGAPAETKPQANGADAGKEKKQSATKAPVEANSDKLSGAELKKRAKLEKAARRAKEREGKQPDETQAPAQPPRPGSPSKKKGSSGKEGSAGSSQALRQQKPASSTSEKVGKAMPARPAANAANQESKAHAKKAEQKKVALFGHLYGQPRRFTIAGAGKDIHPAVLALGLQMSNYVICGSNARCVATLLAFKRVRFTFQEAISEVSGTDKMFKRSSKPIQLLPAPLYRAI